MNFIIVHNVFLLLVIIVIKAIQPDCYKIKGSSVLLLETPLTRSKYISPYTHAQHLTRTSRIFYTFAVTKPLKIPLHPPTLTRLFKPRPLSVRAGKSNFSSARYFGGNLDYGSFDRQLQRDKCRSYDLCVILCTLLHDKLFHVPSGLCLVHGTIFRKRGVFRFVLPKVPHALTVSFLGACTLQQ